MTNGSVQSVLGPVAGRDLGRTLIHEHVLLSLVCYWSPEIDPSIAHEPLSLETLSRVRANPFASRANLRIDDLQTARREIARFAAAGGRTLIDLTPGNIGRDPRALQWIAREAGVNIIAGCGYYIRPSHPPGLEERTVESIAAEMVRELTEGIDGTGVRAGVIGEIGMATHPMHPVERRVVEAAGRAQKETGVAVITHAAPGTESPFEIADLLEAEGTDMSRAVISHLDDRFRTEVGLFRRLAQRGVNFGFDTFGRELYYASRRRQLPSDDTRIEAICALLEAGFRDRVLLAQDICLQHELTAWGGQGYAHILEQIVPRLRERGVTDVELQAMLVDNPRRVLTGAP